MTDEQAERLIKGIQALKDAMLGIFIGVVICYGIIKIGDLMTVKPSTGAGMELFSISNELRLLRSEIERHRTPLSPPIVIPVPPKQSPKKEEK